MIADTAFPQAQLPNPAAIPPVLDAVATELRAMARRIPQWSPFVGEAWETFRDRRLGAERALAKSLSRIPGCTVALSQDGWEVDLTLAGISVRSQERLQGACVAWAAEACRWSPRG
jgi:hypothetical protein